MLCTCKYQIQFWISVNYQKKMFPIVQSRVVVEFTLSHTALFTGYVASILHVENMHGHVMNVILLNTDGMLSSHGHAWYIIYVYMCMLLCIDFVIHCFGFCQ
jgi:hypothetical protein